MNSGSGRCLGGCTCCHTSASEAVIPPPDTQSLIRHVIKEGNKRLLRNRNLILYHLVFSLAHRIQ